MFGFPGGFGGDDERNDNYMFPSAYKHFNASEKPKSKLGRRRLQLQSDDKVQNVGVYKENTSKFPLNTKRWLTDNLRIPADEGSSLTHPISKMTSSGSKPLTQDFRPLSSLTQSSRIDQESNLSGIPLPPTPLKEIQFNRGVSNPCSVGGISLTHIPIKKINSDSNDNNQIQKELNSSFIADDSLPLTNWSDPQPLAAGSDTIDNKTSNDSNQSDVSNDSSFMTAHDIHRPEMFSNRTLYDPVFLKTPGKNLAEIRIEDSPFNPLEGFLDENDEFVENKIKVVEKTPISNVKQDQRTTRNTDLGKSQPISSIPQNSETNPQDNAPIFLKPKETPKHSRINQNHAINNCQNQLASRKAGNAHGPKHIENMDVCPPAHNSPLVGSKSITSQSFDNKSDSGIFTKGLLTDNCTYPQHTPSVYLPPIRHQVQQTKLTDEPTANLTYPQHITNSISSALQPSFLEQTVDEPISIIKYPQHGSSNRSLSASINSSIDEQTVNVTYPQHTSIFIPNVPRPSSLNEIPSNPQLRPIPQGIMQSTTSSNAMQLSNTEKKVSEPCEVPDRLSIKPTYHSGVIRSTTHETPNSAKLASLNLKTQQFPEYHSNSVGNVQNRQNTNLSSTSSVQTNHVPSSTNQIVNNFQMTGSAKLGNPNVKTTFLLGHQGNALVSSSLHAATDKMCIQETIKVNRGNDTGEHGPLSAVSSSYSKPPLNVQEADTGDTESNTVILNEKHVIKNPNSVPQSGYSHQPLNNTPSHPPRVEQVVKPAECFNPPQPPNSVLGTLIRPQPQNVITIKGTPYTVLSLLGRGGSSQVYQALGPQSSRLMAIKCVNLSVVEDAMATDYLNEIGLLSQLQGCPSVIKMFDYEYVSQSKMLYVVLEKGDIDFSKLIKNISETKQISMPMIIYYWTEMLSAVFEIHKRGIIHSDLKPANFLLVEGRLKLIDFGIASSLQEDKTSVMKEVPAGTHNYMSPEAITGPKISRKSDVWSMGCILFNLLYGRTPFSHLNGRWQKLHAIADPNDKVVFPKLLLHAPPSLRLALRWCLLKDPKSRPTVEELIKLSELSPHVGSSLGSEIDGMMCKYFRKIIPNLKVLNVDEDII